MILARLSALAGVFGNNSDAAADFARRWARAMRSQPELAQDLIAHGGLLVQQPVTMAEGHPSPAPIDPYRLAYEAGRRDLAVQLLAAGGITVTELNTLLEDQNHEL